MRRLKNIMDDVPMQIDTEKLKGQCKDCEFWIITQKGYCTPQHIDNVDGDDGCPSWKERSAQPDEELVEKLSSEIIGIIEGHHEDYSKPFDVIWLCHRCHMRLHHTIAETSP